MNHSANNKDTNYVGDVAGFRPIIDTDVNRRYSSGIVEISYLFESNDLPRGSPVGQLPHPSIIDAREASETIESNPAKSRSASEPFHDNAISHSIPRRSRSDHIRHARGNNPFGVKGTRSCNTCRKHRRGVCLEAFVYSLANT